MLWHYTKNSYVLSIKKLFIGFTFMIYFTKNDDKIQSYKNIQMIKAVHSVDRLFEGHIQLSLMA